MLIIERYGSYDLKGLQFIGKGIHGKVYKIDSKTCIKIFNKEEFFEKELQTLKMAQGNAHFPELYCFGNKYIVREFIDGIELDNYLKANPLTLDISGKLICLYEAMYKVGFSRLDTIIFHIFITKDGNLRLIDTARVMKKKSSYPKILLDGLKKLGYKETFLSHVKELRFDLYQKWLSKK